MFEKALHVQAEAAKLGFDWKDPIGVLEKVHEETEEIREALVEGDLAHAQKELGDLLLVLTNLSRFLQITPDAALAGAVDRFEKRFAAVQAEVAADRQDMAAYTLDELEAIWQRVKGRHT